MKCRWDCSLSCLGALVWGTAHLPSAALAASHGKFLSNMVPVCFGACDGPLRMKEWLDWGVGGRRNGGSRQEGQELKSMGLMGERGLMVGHV